MIKQEVLPPWVEHLHHLHALYILTDVKTSYKESSSCLLSFKISSSSNGNRNCIYRTEMFNLIYCPHHNRCFNIWHQVASCMTNSSYCIYVVLGVACGSGVVLLASLPWLQSRSRRKGTVRLSKRLIREMKCPLCQCQTSVKINWLISGSSCLWSTQIGWIAPQNMGLIRLIYSDRLTISDSGKEKF